MLTINRYKIWWLFWNIRGQEYPQFRSKLFSAHYWKRACGVFVKHCCNLHYEMPTCTYKSSNNNLCNFSYREENNTQLLIMHWILFNIGSCPWSFPCQLCKTNFVFTVAILNIKNHLLFTYYHNTKYSEMFHGAAST